MIQNTLMIQGCTSDAGKSALVTGICRMLARRGIRVAPFKPQNMALNSAVTSDGGEIGRAQALQAQACGLEPHTDMNPILLKPSTDIGAQVIIHGHALQNMNARDYHSYKPIAMKAVMDSYQRLTEQYDVVIVEGAGSPAEINLRDRDIANMGFAEAVDCPVILIADIDRGGVFAHLMGTVALLSETEQQRIRGYVINRFRGDINLLTSGLEWLEKESNKPVFGVLPYLQGLHLEAEDAIQSQQESATPEQLQVVIPVMPRISNHTDFDPLRLHPQVNVQFIGPGEAVPAADLIILPGSKSVRDDLEWLREQDWDNVINRHLRYGGKVLGICGGFQMLGREIFDPYGVEGPSGSSQGFGLLEMVTTLEQQKQLHNVTGQLTLSDVPITGYEIHAGSSVGMALSNPAVRLADRDDGAISTDGQLLGTYLHGLFESTAACQSLLEWAGLERADPVDYNAVREEGINRMADAVEQHLDLQEIGKLLDIDLHGVLAAKRVDA